MQAKNISDDVILEAIKASALRTSGWAHLWHIQETLSAFPPKVVRAKLKSMIRRQVIGGCACGCRGDFEILPEVPSYLDSLSKPTHGG
jgi:hypothetical protein